MLPPFDSTGLLPPTTNGSPYVVSVEEIKRRFVDDLGSPAWRIELFDHWDLLRRTVAIVVPTARWWLWGCFISGHLVPLFGERETIQAVVLLPADELPVDAAQRAFLLNSVRSAQEYHRVDVTAIPEFPPGDARNLDTMNALEAKWRPRATVGVADHVAGDLVAAGFVEVRP